VESVTTVLSCAVPAVDDSVKLELPMRNELLAVNKHLRILQAAGALERYIGPVAGDMSFADAHAIHG
jgi:hypothetical protein